MEVLLSSELNRTGRFDRENWPASIENVELCVSIVKLFQGECGINNRFKKHLRENVGQFKKENVDKFVNKKIKKMKKCVPTKTNFLLFG